MMPSSASSAAISRGGAALGDGELDRRRPAIAGVDLAACTQHRAGADHEHDHDEQAEQGQAPRRHPPRPAAAAARRSRRRRPSSTASRPSASPTGLAGEPDRRRGGGAGGTGSGSRPRISNGSGCSGWSGTGSLVGWGRQWPAVGGRSSGRSGGPAVEPGLQEHRGGDLVDDLAAGRAPSSPARGGHGRRSRWSGAHRRSRPAPAVAARSSLDLGEHRRRPPARCEPSSDSGSPTTTHSASASATSSSDAPVVAGDVAAAVDGLVGRGQRAGRSRRGRRRCARLPRSTPSARTPLRRCRRRPGPGRGRRRAPTGPCRRPRRGRRSCRRRP